MSVYLKIKEHKEFNEDCKIIDLQNEYRGFTGKERFAIVTRLNEAELMNKYKDIVKEYVPFLLLTTEQGKVIDDYSKAEVAYRRLVKRRHSKYSIDDGEFEVHHPELATEVNVLEQTEKEELHNCLEQLNEVHRSRVIKYFFYGMSLTEIANEEDVSRQAVAQSIQVAIKHLRKILK